MHHVPLRTCASVAVMAWGLAGLLQAQTNITFEGRLSYEDLHNSNIANIWGYTDEFGTEYALIGVNGNNGGDPGGLSIVDLSDPADPVEIYFLPGPVSIWREIKVWNDHAYVTTEAENGGLTIVDLRPLPQSTDLPSTVFMAPDWDNSHSLFIDENGRLFIFGANRGAGGAIMYDLTQDPMVPVEVGSYDPLYIHDGFARGDTLYAAHVLNGFFSIVDVSDPAAPEFIRSQMTPNAFTHNVWLDASGDHLFTTDERTGAYIGSYDISDPTDIRFLDKLRSDPGSGAIPHNTYWLPSGHVVQSYYTYGVSIYDASRPDNLVEVGSYDTSPISGDGFFGAWGVYPFFASGRLIVSDIEEGLFVLDPTFTRACWLEGGITNAVSGMPVGSANITIVGTEAFDVTGLDGQFGTGNGESGTFTVHVHALGYYDVDIEGVVLENGIVTELDIELIPLPHVTVSGTVRTAGSGAPVADAQVRLIAGEYDFSVLTDVDGAFFFPVVYDGVYEFTVGRWGWHTACPADLVVAGAELSGVQVDLEQGYADDFALDLGWQVGSTAVRGGWARGEPIGTTYNGVPCNPEHDVLGDCFDQAYITGNGGGNAGTDDVDEGGTLLTSPEFDVSMMADPHVRYSHWFFNGGGSDIVDDRFVISLANGEDTVVIETFTALGGGLSEWRFSNIRVADHIAPTSTMRLLAYTADDDPNRNNVEAGLDAVSIVPEATTGLVEGSRMLGMTVWPNPTTGTFTVTLPDGIEGSVQVLDAIGRCVARDNGARWPLVMHLELPPGTYVIKAVTSGGAVYVDRLVVKR
ncbi:MAG: choice-of-anchor B family protein [Flavobacteriales bacterium]|nr:choice-of-anchor B family protein [Flavobacteriales bacterium]